MLELLEDGVKILVSVSDRGWFILSDAVCFLLLREKGRDADSNPSRVLHRLRLPQDHLSRRWTTCSQTFRQPFSSEE